MDSKFKKLFDLVKKNDELRTFSGDDITMGSIAPYGISSGLAELDLFLGRKGGLPASKIIEYYGKPMCGKTTAALQAAAEWQKRGGLVIFIDTEQSYTPGRARELGCIPEDIIKHDCSTVEDIFKTILSYVGEIDIDVKGKRKSKPGTLDSFESPVLFIVDSTTAVPTLSDAQGNIDDADRPGYEAKQIKRGLRKVNPMLSMLKCAPTIIFINHAVAKIAAFGKQTDSGGGFGIKFYASVRVEFTHMGNLNNSTTKERYGQKIKIQIEKLKGSSLEFPTFTADLLNEGGFNQYESLKLAMISTGFADRPAKSQTLTVLPNTQYEVQVKQTEFKEWVDDLGYNEVYRSWRRWCVAESVLVPWGRGEV